MKVAWLRHWDGVTRPPEDKPSCFLRLKEQGQRGTERVRAMATGLPLCIPRTVGEPPGSGPTAPVHPALGLPTAP